MRRFYNIFCVLLLSALVTGCSTAKYSPYKKFPAASLQKDYKLLQDILERNHPSLYWYTPKDSMDMYFDIYYAQIKDSMSEGTFAWKILAPLIQKIHCGHTSLQYSKNYTRWAKGKKFASFPLFFRAWADTLAVTGSYNRNDSVFKWGTVVKAIDGRSSGEMIDNIFNYLPTDGYAENINYERLSRAFPRYHNYIYGLRNKYAITYSDSTTGADRIDSIPLWQVLRDTSKAKDKVVKDKKPPKEKIPRSVRQERYRSLRIDSTGTYAVMTLNSFTKGNIRTFFRQSFKELHHKRINHLIIDLRANGGGRVNLSTLLTKYISREPFRLADTVQRPTKFLGNYTRYIHNGFFQNVAMFFSTKKKADGNYHIGRMERKVYTPKSNNHYGGNVYVLINGATFSASTVFCNAIQGQENIMIVGEESGGGAYGNNGILIPNLKLPLTKLQVRLPLFRLVQYNHPTAKGKGIVPDLLLPPSYEALLQRRDSKLERVVQMIMSAEN